MKQSLRAVALVFLLAGSSSASLAGQWPSEIVLGTRVRARLPEVQYQPGDTRGHLLRGRVMALTSDTLYLAITDSLGPLAVPRSLIQRLDYSRGVPSRTSSAVQRGLLAGAAYSLLFVLVNEMEAEPDRASTGTAALVGGGIGITTGAILGALFPRERWKSVRLGVEPPR